MKKNTVIIIDNEAFHQGWIGATRRILHVAEAFRRLNYEVVLLAAPQSNPPIQQELDNLFPGTVIRTKHSGSYPAIFDSNYLLRRFWRLGWKFRGNETYWSKLHWGWASKLDIDNLKEQLSQFNIKPSLLWGISAGYLDGAFAANRLAKKLNIPWVFELHDPPRVVEGLGFSSTVKNCFLHLLNESSKIIVTANSYRDILISKYNVSPSKCSTIHLSFDGDIIKDNKKDRAHFTLAYVGSLNGGRSLAPLIEAINLETTKNPIFRKSIRLRVAGIGPGFDEINKLVIKYGLEDVVHNEGRKSKEEAEEIIKSSDVIVIVQEAINSAQIPGKIFESIQTSNHILGLMPEDCEAAYILKKSGLAYICPPKSIENIHIEVTGMWKKWRSNDFVSTINENYIHQFQSDNLYKKIESSILELL